LPRQIRWRFPISESPVETEGTANDFFGQRPEARIIETDAAVKHDVVGAVGDDTPHVPVGQLH
jgi:hypothetical protein